MCYTIISNGVINVLRKNTRRTKKYQYKKKINIDREKLLDSIKYNVRINKNDIAYTLTEEYLNLYPDDDYVRIYQCIILEKLNKTEDAQKGLVDILNNNSLSNNNRAFALVELANIFEHNKKIDLAIENYEKAIEISDDIEIIARGELSKLYCEKKDFEKALNILEIDGYNNDFLNAKRALVYFKKGELNLVINEFKRPYLNKYNIYEKEKLDDNYLSQDRNYIIGHTFLKMGRKNTALIYLNKATTIKNRSVYFKAYMDIAKIYIFNNNLDDAIALCIDLLTQSTSTYNNKMINEILAKAYTKKNDYEKALETYKDESFNELDRKMRIGFLELEKGNFKKAEEYLDLLDIEKEDVNKNINEFYRLALVKLRLGKYDEVLNILNIFDELGTRREIKEMKYEFDRMRLLIDIKLGNKLEDREYSYSEMQIISYDKQRAIEHIKDHHLIKENISKFNDEDQIILLFDEVQKELTSNNIIYDSSYDKYVVKIKNVGSSKTDNVINQLFVLTVPNTKNIITMYPAQGNESEFIIEETKSKQNDQKTKRLTQIEKFNKKYGNN